MYSVDYTRGGSFDGRTGLKSCHTWLRNMARVVYFVVFIQEEAKMILLCIDSTFKGFYSPYPMPKEANKKYLVDYMDFPEL
ncbi:hypothetical protein [Desulforamulus reducens]|uniref:hypothetical protein n=1 Tax=Desulforamulus reducens TaxID=59610 RepID=UPI0018DDB21C|nr:hypothetical protein [Desulforamulus reducens]